MAYSVCSFASAHQVVWGTQPYCRPCTAKPCCLGEHTGTRTWPSLELDPAMHACVSSIAVANGDKMIGQLLGNDWWNLTKCVAGLATDQTT